MVILAADRGRGEEGGRQSAYDAWAMGKPSGVGPEQQVTAGGSSSQHIGITCLPLHAIRSVQPQNALIQGLVG